MDQELLTTQVYNYLILKTKPRIPCSYNGEITLYEGGEIILGFQNV
jgi:hypothetical protein